MINETQYKIALEFINGLTLEYQNYLVNRRISVGYKEFGVFILINQINDTAHSVNLLINNNMPIGINSLTRVLLEKYVFLKHILKNSNNAKAFILHLEIEKLKNFNLYFNTENDSDLIYKELGKDKLAMKREVLEKFPSYSDTARIEKLMTEYSSCFSYDVEKIEKIKWYNFNGKTNDFRKLCMSLDLEYDYLTLYKLFSGEVHSSSLGDRFVLSSELSQLGVIDNYKTNDSSWQFLFGYINKTIQLICKEFGLQDFEKTYRKKIQEKHDYSSIIQKKLIAKFKK